MCIFMIFQVLVFHLHYGAWWGAADHDRVDLDASLVLRAEASAALFKHWAMASPPHVVVHDNGGLVSLRLLLEYKIFEFLSYRRCGRLVPLVCHFSEGDGVGS